MKTLASATRVYGCRNRSRRGVATVEFALVVVLVMLPLVMAILEYNWMAKHNLQISNAARDGARLASTGSTTSQIRSEVQREVTIVSLPSSEIVMEKSTNGTTWTTLGDTTGSSPANNASSGDMVRVTVNHPYTSLTKFWPFMNSGRKVQAIAVFRRE